MRCADLKTDRYHEFDTDTLDKITELVIGELQDSDQRNLEKSACESRSPRTTRPHATLHVADTIVAGR